jgi:hypothetical protein
MKLNFQPFRTKIHYALIQNQLDIYELVKKLVKIQLIYANIMILKNNFFQLAQNNNNHFLDLNDFDI